MCNLTSNCAGPNHQIDRAITEGDFTERRRPIVTCHVAELMAFCVPKTPVEFHDDAESCVHRVAPRRRAA